MRKYVSVLLHKILDYSEGQSPNYTMGLWKTSEQGELLKCPERLEFNCVGLEV